MFLEEEANEYLLRVRVRYGASNADGFLDCPMTRAEDLETSNGCSITFTLYSGGMNGYKVGGTPLQNGIELTLSSYYACAFYDEQVEDQGWLMAGT